MATVESSREYIYFDNAATTFPKPHEVVDAVVDYLTRIGGNPGRSGHALSVDAGEAVFHARDALSRCFGVANPMNVIFCSNATDALNLAIQGMLQEGDHVITTAMEHNSTIRPLKELELRKRTSLTIIPCRNGKIDINMFESAVKPETKLAVVNHASNVFGTEQPLNEIGALCRKMNIALLADCAQSAGIIPINIKEEYIDIIAFSGHKGLYGPTGTGGLVLSDDFDHSRIKPLKFGGTGSQSDRIYQPNFIPDVFESGTLNAAGIKGLHAGVHHILSLSGGIKEIQKHKKELAQYFIHKGDRSVQGFRTYVPSEINETGVISFNIDGMEPSDVAFELSERYSVLCRAGLHCAPLAHQSIGTFPAGTVRFSFSIFNTKEEIDRAIDALAEISRNRL